MLWRSVFLKTLREGRVAVLGWGIGMGLMVMAVEASVGSVMGAPGAKQALQSITESFRWAADPVAVTTVGGYATWKLAFTVLMVAIWPIIAATRVLRGAEERGTMDVLLSVPRGRLRVALESVAAIWVNLLAMALLTSLLAYAGGLASNAGFSLADALMFGLNLALACGVFGSLALLIGQFTPQARTASGAAGGLLFVAIVLDMLHRIVPGTTWLSALSPVYYFNLSKPLVPSFGSSPVGLAVLAGASLVLSGAAIALFVRRDVGLGVRMPWSARQPAKRVGAASALAAQSGDWSLRSIYLRAIAAIVAPTLWWTLAVASFAAFTMLATKQMGDQFQQLIQDSPPMRLMLAALGGGAAEVSAQLLSALFIFLPLLVMVFAVTQAGRWAGDEEEGRHDLILATPNSRSRLLLARYSAIATAAVFIAAVTLGVVIAAAAATGLALNAANLVAATLLLVPQCLLMAAIGYLAAGWLGPALESGLLSFLLAFWFFLSFVAPELGWSPVLQKLSAFFYYGTPVTHGVALGNLVIVLGASVLALVLAVLRFRRKDIGRTFG